VAQAQPLNNSTAASSGASLCAGEVWKVVKKEERRRLNQAENAIMKVTAAIENGAVPVCPRTNR